MVAENKKTINIDLEQVTFYPVLNFYQYDNNVIEFIVSKDGDYADLGALTSVFLNFQRNDNVIISRQLTVSGNRALYVMGDEEMALTGQANINVQLFKEDERLTAVLLRANIVKTFGVIPNTITSESDPSNIQPGEDSETIITDPNGGGEQLDETVLTQYLKITDAELTYRKVTDKITEADLDDEVVAKLGAGSATTADVVPDKWFVVCVAGQSNALGYDESPVSNVISKNLNPNRIRQLGLYDHHNLQIVPLTHHADAYENVTGRSNPATPDKKGTKGVHLPLANLLLNEIPEDYGVLMISTAFGGTGFTHKTRSNGLENYNAELKKPNTYTVRKDGQYNWGKESAYFYGMRDRIKHMLDLNPENIFGGVVWIQGEEDYADPAGHKVGFNEMTTEFFRYFNEENEGKYKNQVAKRVWDKDLWYNVETVNYFYEELNADAVWKNYRDFNMKTYVEIPRDTDSNAINGTSGPTTPMARGHFGNDAYTKVIAPRIFKKMSENGALIKGAVPIAAAATSQTTVTKVVNEEESKERALEASDFSRVGDNSAGTFESGVIKFNSAPTGWTSNIDFKGAYKLTFDAAQKDYVIAFRGDINGDWSAIRVGNVNAGQMYEYIDGSLKTITKVDSAVYALQDGDQVQVTLEDDGILNIKVKKKAQAGQGFQQWAQVNTKQAGFNSPDKRALGFIFGANATNSQLPPNDINTVMKNVVIQKEKPQTVTETAPGTAAVAANPDSVVGSIIFLYSNKQKKYEVNGATYVRCDGTVKVTRAEYPQLFEFFGNPSLNETTLANVSAVTGTFSYICAKN